MRNTTRLGTFALLTLMVAGTAHAGFYAITDKFGYTITMTKYGSLEDAQAGVNPGTSYNSAQYLNSDGSIYFVRDLPDVYNNTNIVMTSWWYTTNPDHGADSGWGNPSNTDTGFMQLYEDPAATDMSISGAWSVLNLGVADGSTFQLNASGANADYASSYARLWHGGVGGAAGLTAGTFLTWNLDFKASGLTANLDGDLAVSIDHPDDVSGKFWGIFQNTSTLDTSLNGYYVFEANFNNTNWAYENRDRLNGTFNESNFGAPVPEPVTMILGAGALALAALRRRRRA